MSDTPASLQRKINSASDLQSVVRTMKAMAASSIGQYENAVTALNDYYRTVQLGLSVSFRDQMRSHGVGNLSQKTSSRVAAVVFGSDQGLVGQFNEVMVDYVTGTLSEFPGEKIIWSVGERIHARLANTEYAPAAWFTLPSAISSISALVGQVLTEIEQLRQRHDATTIYLFHHRPTAGSIYQPVSQRLLPLDTAWQNEQIQIPWPSHNVPEMLNQPEQTLGACVREYLFVSLFRACAESLASENASRLAAMQRAEKNIDELLEALHATFHQLRQSSIDEELFDLVSGFEALSD